VHSLKHLLILIFIALCPIAASAQTRADSAFVSDASPVQKGHKHSPKTATLLSMAVPGLGQVYNKKNWWWKVPAIYAVGGGLVYAVSFYHNGYIEFRRHYQYIRENNLTTLFIPGYGTYRAPTVQAIRDSYKDSRDLYIIYTTLFYVLQVVDASVEAHFLDFNVSDNLSLKLQPGVEQQLTGNLAFSARLTLNMK
jgi:hypothetical protein